MLRDYFELEFKQAFSNITHEHNLTIEFNLERVIDDIIFMCFFIGNDFLPSLSVLDIAEASIDMIFDIYKFKVLPATDHYLTEDGDILWNHAKILISEFAEHELSVLNKRMKKIMDLKGGHKGENMDKAQIKYFELKKQALDMTIEKKDDLIDWLYKHKLHQKYLYCKEKNIEDKWTLMVRLLKKERLEENRLWSS